MKLRGYLALVVVCAGLLACDPIQRTFVWLRVKLRPARRVRTLGSWIQAMATMVLEPLARIGGASLPEPDRVVPCAPGVLIVMNHQSLLDIPLVVKTVADGYPRIVTRARYHRFVPLISHMVRLYQYPLVDPSANARKLLASLESLAQEARDSDVPIAIFPEGTRTRDGEIGRFKTRGLTHVLGARDWRVHVFVADGFWQTARFKDFLLGMGRLKGRMAYLGQVAWDDPTADPQPFIDDLREMMIDGLRELRAEAVQA